MKKKIRIGTRGSSLALVQTDLVIDAIREKYPEYDYEVVVKRTTGDKILDKPLLEFGGKGVFVTEFEDAILQGELDIAVHSAKDMPMEIREGLDIIGVLKREDPRDVLITLQSTDINEIEKAIIGTSSLRRQTQIQELYRNIQCSSLRGNVNTRLKKLSEGMYDGIILAAAGINRLKLDQLPEFKYRYLSIDEIIPAGGQGIIAIEGRKDSEIAAILSQISNPNAGIELATERKALEFFHAGCHEPIGVYSMISGDDMKLWMMKEHKGRLIKKKGCITLDKRLTLVEEMVKSIQEEC